MKKPTKEVKRLNKAAPKAADKAEKSANKAKAVTTLKKAAKTKSTGDKGMRLTPYLQTNILQYSVR